MIDALTNKRQQKESFVFTPSDIDAATNFISEGLAQLGVSRKDILRTRLSVEEILLNWQATANDDDRFIIEIYPRLWRVALRIRYKGTALNPMEIVEDELFGSSDFGRSVLENLGLSLSWQYQDGCNIVCCSLKKEHKLSQMKLLILAMLAAALFGGCSFLLPQMWRDFILLTFVDPLLDAFLAAFSCVVGPMMFLSMLWGIINIGDTRQLGLIGKKLFIRFMVISTLFGAFCLLVTILAFQPDLSGEKGGQSLMHSMTEMLLDIIPSNIVEPFLSGNTLQILFLGVVIGVVIIIARDRMSVMIQAVEQANTIAHIILSVVSSLMPVFIFLSVLRLILQGTLARNLAGLLGVILLTVFFNVIDVILETLSLMRIGLPLSQIIKKLGPAFLIALSTASSAAAFPTMLKTCETGLGVDKKLVNFALPFGSVVFMPHTVSLFIAVPMFAAQVYGIDMTMESAVILLVDAVILSVATPPIPGGALSCFALLFIHLNIPLEAISLAVASIMVLDFTGTASNLYALQAQLIHGARRLKAIDETVLFKPQ